MDRDYPITVTWDKETRDPRSFVWRGHTYRVEQIVSFWVIETGWWSEETNVKAIYWCVRSEGRTFEIKRDQLRHRWFLSKALG